MTDETALSADSQPDAVTPTPETLAPDGAESKETAPATEPKEDPSLTANGERLDRVTRNWRALERDRDHWREMAMRQTPAPKAEPETPDKAKTLADFEYDESKYQTYLFEKAEERASRVAERKLTEAQEREAAQRRAQTFKQREAEFAKSTPDYFEVSRSVPINDAVGKAIMALENGPLLAHYLGKNPDIAFRLDELSPEVAIFELGEINAKLKAEREKARAPTVSKAPPPTPKIEGAGDPAVEKDPSTMTDREFAKWRRKQIAQRRK